MSEKISFKFEELKYQDDAVDTVVDLLSGIDRYSISSIYSNSSAIRPLTSTHPEANVRFNAGTRLVENLQKIQYRNGLFKDNGIVGAIPQFSIEMETGTGKTFVYLKTILKLWKEYGGQFKKFIIVVPSNPILMGVQKSIKMFADYFKPQFDNIDISEHSFVFDKNCRVETVTSKFIESTSLSIMLITCHSFNKESNRLRTPSENGVVVWEDIKDIAPIVIIDEPQKLDGTAKKKSASLLALEELNPPMMLRYSATHKNLYNQIYKLDSYQAYKEHLVKGIKVTTIHSLMPKQFPYVRYVKFNSETLRAVIEIFCNKQGNTTRCTKFEVDANASLEELSGGMPQYKNWFVAEQPHKLHPLVISQGNGDLLYLEMGKSNDDVEPEVSIKKQIRLAIEAHLNKQIDILRSKQHIKALTLFFIDAVAKVRGNSEDGRGEYLVWFDEIFEDIRQEPKYQLAYKEFPEELSILDLNCPVTDIREGYFACDKNKQAVEIEKWDSSVDDADISFDAKTQENIDRGFDLILNKKDELISFSEKLTFIFSHSALREGWDNPNVFTLVTLKQGSSDIAKKQEIGRGLRLPVDTNGARCKNDEINELTVIANDYYDQFAEALHSDYNKSMGFNKNEVSADIIKRTMINAGVPTDKIEEAFDAFKREILSSGMVKVDSKTGKLIVTDKAEDIQTILFNDPTLIEHSASIIDSFVKLMTEKGSKKVVIVNGDETPFENGFQSYVHETEFNAMYRKMLSILQKKSIYQYNFDKDKFIAEAASELNRLFAKKNDRVIFEVTNAKVAFNDAQAMQMANAQRTLEESEDSDIKYAKRPIFELANYIMFNTMLPRLAVIRIINKLNDVSRNRINNQDYLEEAVKLINKLLVKYKSDNFSDAEIICGKVAEDTEIFEIDKIANEEEFRYVFTPNSSHRRALNLKYKFDSEGELKFAKALDDDDNVLMFTKLRKGGFVLDTPVGQYSPDWAIVYRKSDESLGMYFIAETKWDKTWDDLSDDERIKIRCAKQHFKAVNDVVDETVKYAWVNSYKDITSDNSFPQVFIDEAYSDTTAIERVADENN